MRRVVAAVLLVLMICGLCACKKAEKANPTDPGELILDPPSQNQIAAEDIDGVSVTVIDGSDLSAQEMEEIRGWTQCPIEQIMYTLVYEEYNIAAKYNIPEVLDGYWTVEDYHNDYDGTLDLDTLSERDSYNFVFFIYDNVQKTLYEIHFNNEQ